MPQLLVEIGTEELPPAALDVVYQNLAPKAEEILRASRLGWDQVFAEATPRRIALFVKNLAARQADQVLEISGPSFERAYGAEGKPTPALEGFLKSRQARLKDVEVKETPKGKFVILRRREVGRPAAALVPEILTEIVTSIPFPKRMRWESSGFRFPRPIRWLVVLLDGQALSVKMAGVKSSARSFGHRRLSAKPFTMRRADWKGYQQELKRRHVLLSSRERKQRIHKELRGRFQQRRIDEELVHGNAELTEQPFLLQGTFSKTYLDLPAEVLASSMKKNQKVFACYDARGHLVNRFVAVLDGRPGSPSKVRSGYENVLDSRLRDARYFYDADTREPLEKKVALLDQIVYLGKLGTMRQKVERLGKLAEKFAAFVGRDDLKADLRRVAWLSKADLMTQLVFEFPDLQGIAGREYALESGESEEVARAIGSQYLPRNLAQDHRELQKAMTPLGALFGIVDRMDLLVGAFGIGLEPTGSQDPYALRRAGGGLVKLVRAFRFHFSLREMMEVAYGLYGSALERNHLQVKSHVIDQFLKERVAFELQLKPGTRPMEIFQAVWGPSHDNLADVFNRFEVLTHLAQRDPEGFRQASKVVERTANILKGVRETVGSVDPALFQESLERELYNLLESRSSEIRECLNRRDYENATLLYGHVFYQPLHQFFDRVMVNVEDPRIRSNRHALMKSINHLYTERLADLSVLTRTEGS